MILIIDNYDPYINTLVDLVHSESAEAKMARNDEITLSEICEMRPSGIVISPTKEGSDVGVSLAAIETFASIVPILGFGLGYRAICHAFGATSTDPPENGNSAVDVSHDGLMLFEGLPDPFPVPVPTEKVLDREDFPTGLEVAAHTENGVIMGIRHRGFRTEGVQFHPAHVNDKIARTLVQNWLDTLYDIDPDAFAQLDLPDPEETQETIEEEDDGPDPSAQETMVYDGDMSMYERISAEHEAQQKEEAEEERRSDA